jgi:uncharacterized protein YabN with tetrapyrrole methylase and pyrophosphatase domain
MARLRSPTGCPWDREQTYGTLADDAEEAYEALKQSRKHKQVGRLNCDELGDLLFQIVSTPR